MGGAVLGGIGTHPVLAGGAGASFSRYLMGLLEVSVIPTSNRTLLPTSAQVRGSNIFDFNFALHGTIPIGRWEPYGIFGVAVLMNPYSAGFVNSSGSFVWVGERHSKFALETGAGCRFYVSPKWGFRAEYRYTSSVPNFNRALAGVFYRVDSGSWFGLFPMLARHFR